ncbi:phage tail protein [Acidiluteibacter ferrifornacis]|uniref:Phage tail protein n=1 Tax=Acidiluteibacter ferrifornacis TaxID=2692424 RepID=A0A6N9NLN3_9FLAO|nr:phage tail protein [Acidiluteibacter ferrifornacis]MBR9831054.1 phage tail protein [bacterium]NBG66863.1 phage tail protein [Acidiluteibacter ferrifornacis]
MVKDGSKQESAWPMPQFRFKVDLATELEGVGFQEVYGLDVENQIIDYDKADSHNFSTEKIPGIVKYGTIILKRGVFVNNYAFWMWKKEVTMNKVKRRTILINLLDESGETTMQWQLDQAWPIKITCTDLKSDGDEVAVDTLEIAHNGLTLTKS